MNPTKILGWFLLISGILIIIFSLFNSWNIFTGKTQSPAIFKMGEQKEEPLPQTQKIQAPEEKAEEMVQQELQKQLQKVLPADTIPKLLNLISWSILAGILIFGGTQISSLGIKLIKI